MKIPTKIVIVIAALVAGCFDPDDYELTPEKVASILTVEVKGSNQIPADGFTTTTLTATIRPANAKNRILLVTTDRGTLLKGSGKDTNGTLEVTPGPDGTVDVDIKSSTLVGVATVVVSAKANPLISVSAEIDFEPIEPDDVVRFISVPATLPADNVSQATIETQVNTSIAPAERTAVFETTLGSLIPSTKSVLADADGVARITLQSSNVIGSARVTVTAASVVRQTTVDFVRALPTAITASAPMLIVTAADNSSAEVIGLLTRHPGTVSDGTVVLFEALRTDTGQAIGVFRNVTNSTGGRVTASFLPGTTSYRGDVELRVSLPDRSVSGSTLIRVTSP